MGQPAAGQPPRPTRPSDQWLPWQVAWERALYGPDGFYRRPEGPAGHFRTASHAAPAELAAALHRLARSLGCTAIVDVGAGRGELLTALDSHRSGPGQIEPGCSVVDLSDQAMAGPAPAGSVPAAGPGPRPGPDELRLWGVDVVTRPNGLPSTIGWSPGLDGLDGLDGLSGTGPDSLTTTRTATTDGSRGLPDEALAGALVIGWELLDVVPCPVLELDDDGDLRLVLVDPATGRERASERAGPAELDWCERWWPTAGLEPGDRVEVGAGRDALWAGLVGRGRRAGARALLAVDYAHLRADRPAAGSLTGFRAGRAVPPRPDGSMDVTAHVAIDAVAVAGLGAGATSSDRSDQATRLRELGVRDGELLDPGALGGFSWLLQTVG